MTLQQLPPLAFVDIETTGSTASGDRIIEIGVLRVENGEVKQVLNTLINPNTYLEPFISDMTGIKPEELKKAPTFREKMEDIYEILDGCIFVAHNARFDYGFIRNEFKRHGYTYTANVLCTVKLSRMLFPEHMKHNLDVIMERFELVCEDRHRAYGDAKVVWDFIQKIASDYTHLPLFDTINHLIREPSLPRHLQYEQIDHLDEIPGVYIFYDASNHPLYIGKSKSLRNRILSHFSGDSSSPTEMIISQQVQRIETIPTAGELGALILEAQLIKEKKPMYNRKLRGLEKMTLMKQTKNEQGYYSVVLKEVDTIDVNDLQGVLHISKSKQASKNLLNNLCKEHGLCKKIMGLEKTNTTCFNYKIGKCDGACAGIEDVESYNAKFEKVFENLRVPEWPYRGPIMVTEKDKNREITEVFLFNNWCCLAKLNEHDVNKLSESSFIHEFDYDTYKILKLFLRKNMIHIQPLKKFIPSFS